MSISEDNTKEFGKDKYTDNIDTDFWFYEIGVNVIGADTKNKKIFVKWSEWQDKSLSSEIYEEWKRSGEFNNGCALVSGRIWRGKYQGKYLCAIDIDNKVGIKEFLGHFGEDYTLEKLGEKTIVEWHPDNGNKTHVYFIVEKPLSKRSGVGINSFDSISDDKKDIPAIEVKSEGKHGIMYCTPSLHKDGCNYEILGTTTPTVLNIEQSQELEERINQIYAKYDLSANREKVQIPIKSLFAPNYQIMEGNNRHEDLLRIMESLIQKNKGILSEGEIKELAQKWNQKHCKPPLDDKEFERQWNDAKNFITKKNQEQRSFIDCSNENNNDLQQSTIKADELKCKLFDNIPDKEIVEYILRILQKTVKREDSLIRLILYTALSTFTSDPLNLGIVAPTSEGKTYAVSEVMKLFPKQRVWMIGNMSPKVLIRDKGIQVDKNNNEPIAERVAELKSQIDREKDETIKNELKDKLKSLYDNSKVLIDLSNIILVFLEPPHPETWNILKPILSHDALEIEHPYVYKTETRGLEVKHIVTRGWPACIFCSARDDSSWSMWPEIQSRFFIASPNMVKQKYQDSNALIAQRKGLPSVIQEQLVISNKETETAKDCILLLIEELLSNYKNNVWIPFYSILSDSLPSEKGPDVRVAGRIFSLLNLITKINSLNRPKLVIDNETLAVSLLSDLEQVLMLIHNITGIPSYKIDFLTEIFIPLFLSKTEPLHKDDIAEERIAVYTNELADYYKKQKGKSLTTDAIKKTYLIELKNNGLIDDFQSAVDKRKNGYYPIVDINQFNNSSRPSNNYSNTIKEKSRNYTNLSDNDNKLQFYKLKLSNNFKNINENWLEFQIIELLKYGIGKANIFKLVDKDNNQVCICRFVKEYNRYGSLSRYFQSAENSIYSNKIFGVIRKL